MVAVDTNAPLSIMRALPGYSTMAACGRTACRLPSRSTNTSVHAPLRWRLSPNTLAVGRFDIAQQGRSDRRAIDKV